MSKSRLIRRPRKSFGSVKSEVSFADSQEELSSEDETDEQGSQFFEAFQEWLDAPGHSLLPVFGKFESQLVHSTVLLGFTVIIACTVPAIATELRDIPGPLARVVGWLACCYALSALIRLWLSRSLLSSHSMARMWGRVNDFTSVDPVFTDERSRSIIIASRHENLAETRRNLLRELLLMGYIIPISLVIAAGIGMFLSARMPLYFRVVVPAIGSFYFGAHTMVALATATKFCKICVNNFTEELPSKAEIAAIDKLPPGYWTRRAKEYEELDELMTELMAQVFNVLLVQIAVFAAMIWIAVFSAVMTMSSDPEAATAFLGIAILLAAIIIQQLYPVAGIHTLGHSKHPKTPGLVMRAMRCSVVQMEDHARLEYTNFLQIIGQLPIGAKMPLLGMVTLENLEGYVKGLAAVVPLGWTFTLTIVHGHHNQD